MGARLGKSWAVMYEADDGAEDVARDRRGGPLQAV